MYSLHPEVTNIVEETLQIRYKAVYNYISKQVVHSRCETRCKQYKTENLKIYSTTNNC